jgi:large subunit ribosomal protein L2
VPPSTSFILYVGLVSLCLHIQAYNSTSPGLRGRVITSRSDLWKGKPYKPLTKGLKKSGGRNNSGKITVWHNGGGHKRLYRTIDFKRALRNIAGTVQRIEYDPNRTARIALIKYEQEATLSYQLATAGMVVGDRVVAGIEGQDIRAGYSMPLEAMPVGTQVNNVELRQGQGGKLVRAAGATAMLVKKSDDGYATLKLPSGEHRLVLSRCLATVGIISNGGHRNRKLGKAGAKRWLGIRPTVRGVAMNPVDHPHGGGEGRTSGGRPSCTPWGFQSKGKRTRKRKDVEVFRVARRSGSKSHKKTTN